MVAASHMPKHPVVIPCLRTAQPLAQPPTEAMRQETESSESRIVAYTKMWPNSIPPKVGRT